MNVFKPNAGFEFIQEVYEFQRVPLRALEFLCAEGLLSRRPMCPVCGREMKLVIRDAAADGVEWLCCIRRASEVRHRRSRTVRFGSWFVNSKFMLGQMIMLFHMWVTRPPLATVCNQLCTKEQSNVRIWFAKCRQVCIAALREYEPKLGGPGCVVQIDESIFGEWTAPVVDGNDKRRWVLGGIVPGAPACFLEVVRRRDAKTLLRVIKAHVLPGTTIYTDCFRSYNCLAREGFEHYTVNHTNFYKDPTTGVHTNDVEALWSAVKLFMPENKRTDKVLATYLSEFVYRRLKLETAASNTERFKIFLSDVAKYKPPP